MNRIQALEIQKSKAEEIRDEAIKALEKAGRRVARVNSEIMHAQSETVVSTVMDVTCSECGADVRTERLFSEHYVIPDWRYANLGNCPNKSY